MIHWSWLIPAFVGGAVSATWLYSKLILTAGRVMGAVEEAAKTQGL